MSDFLTIEDLQCLATNGNGHKPIGTKSDLSELAEEADRILADESIPSLERLIHLRAFADKLTTRVNESELRQLLWSARRKANGAIEPHGPGSQLSFKPVPWLWEGVVMEGTTNLVVALPKVGKSRLISQFLGALARGETSFLGQRLTATLAPFLIVGTDQPESDWATCLHLSQLLPDGAMHDRIVGLYDKARPLHLNQEGIETIAAFAAKFPGLIILLDSYFASVSQMGLQERDANYAGPLLDLQEAVAPHKATLIVIHHSNKASAGEGASNASRGTTAIPGAVSQTISLSRLPKPSPLAPSDKRIKLTTEGRGGQPLELLIEQVDDGRSWISHGDADSIARITAAEEVVNRLNDRQSAALEDLCAHWHATGQPMDAVQLAAALGIEGTAPDKRAAEVLRALAKHHLVERAGDRPATGGRGGQPSPLYRPTEISLCLYPQAPSFPSVASLGPTTDATDAIDGCCVETDEGSNPALPTSDLPF